MLRFGYISTNVEWIAYSPEELAKKKKARRQAGKEKAFRKPFVREEDRINVVDFQREWVTGDEAQMERLLRLSQTQRGPGHFAGAGASPLPFQQGMAVKWADLHSVKRWLEDDGIRPCGQPSGQELFVDGGDGV